MHTHTLQFKSENLQPTKLTHKFEDLTRSILHGLVTVMIFRRNKLIFVSVFVISEACHVVIVTEHT